VQSVSRLQCGRFELPLERPLIMAVLNLTPDSFSDGGLWLDPQRAIEQAHALIEQGADLIDLGAESTRPGAQPVPASLEIERLAPLLHALRDVGVPLSVDTRKPEVMRAAIAMGADLINDVQGFDSVQAIDAVAHSRVACCVMHMQGKPHSMQTAPSYQDVVSDVRNFLAQRVAALQDAGVTAQRIVIDPGIGFGKSLAHNLSLLAHLDALRVQSLPILVGVSRKSMIGALTGRDAHERLAGSLAAMLAAVSHGASLVRVHDVAATRDALRVWSAIQDAATG
jgi:dihydropteroate synthase